MFRYEIRFFWMTHGDPPVIAAGSSASKAKYQAFLETDWCNNFGDFLKSIESCKRSGFADRYSEPNSIPSFAPGDQVMMTGCLEAEKHKGKTWTVKTGPQYLCGSWVVWLSGYVGAFDCTKLKKAILQKGK